MAGRGLYAVPGICPASTTDSCGVENRYAQQSKEYGGAEEYSAARVGFMQQSVLISPTPQCGTDFRFPCRAGTTCRAA